MNIQSSILELIGKTPMIYYTEENFQAKVALKLEFLNPLSSVKDRIALAMIEAAEKEGKLQKGMTIIEPTSGNTGIGLAFVAASKGYKTIFTMPESMSLERRKILTLFGATLILTPAPLGMKGAVQEAQRLLQETPHSFMPSQFSNPHNPEVHEKTTALEIWKDTEGKVDIFISGVGTGGTLSGVGKVLKQNNPQVKIVAVEPEESPVLSGGQPSPHKIQGIGAGFIPENCNISLIDEIMKVSSSLALQTARETILKGIPIGISSGATLYAAKKLALLPENKDKLIVVIMASSMERYLSSPLTEHLSLS